MENYRLLTLTHKEVRIEDLGKFTIPAEDWAERLGRVRGHGLASEVMLLSTCNRIAFLLSSDAVGLDDKQYIFDFFSAVYSGYSSSDLQWLTDHASYYKGEQAIQHLFEVASSLHSLVVGEREIITQVRKDYERCRDLGLCADDIRIAVQQTILAAKEVFTNTGISTRPVSVVSLAYRKLIEHGVPKDARFLIVGAGQTNTLMSRFLVKHGYHNFRVFNRSMERAEALGRELSSPFFRLSELGKEGKDFDVIITCTAATDHIIQRNTYEQMLDGDQRRKLVIDLAVPHDISPDILQAFNIRFIDVSLLQQLAENNLQERKAELGACAEILENKMKDFRILFRVRQLELMMSEVPEQVRAIRHHALENVFSKEIEQLDQQGRELIEKVAAYMEKKFIAVPMKLSRKLAQSESL